MIFRVRILFQALVSVFIFGGVTSCSTPAPVEEKAPKRTGFVLRSISLNETGPATVTHAYQATESLWFISQIYYGRSEAYPEIMAANGIENPLDIDEGTLLEIRNPKYFPEQPTFQARLEKITQERAIQLIAKKQRKQNRDLASEKNKKTSSKSQAESNSSPAHKTK